MDHRAIWWLRFEMLLLLESQFFNHLSPLSALLREWRRTQKQTYLHSRAPSHCSVHPSRGSRSFSSCFSKYKSQISLRRIFLCDSSFQLSGNICWQPAISRSFPNPEESSSNLNIWRILQLTKARQPRMLAGAAAHFYGFVSFLKHSDVSSQPALVCNVLYYTYSQFSRAEPRLKYLVSWQGRI